MMLYIYQQYIFTAGNERPGTAGTASDTWEKRQETRPPFNSYGEYPKLSAVHMDLVGPLPSVHKRYLVTLFDRGSRWFDAYPCTHASADSAVKALLKFVSHVGVPELLISDRGTHFEASLF